MARKATQLALIIKNNDINDIDDSDDHVLNYVNSTLDVDESSSHIKLGPLFCLNKIPTRVDCNCFRLQRNDTQSLS